MMNQEKMIKTAKALHTVFRIARKIALIALIVLVVAVSVITIAHFINPDVTFSEGYLSVEVGSVSVMFQDELSLSNRQILVHVWIISLFALGSGLILYAILLRAGKILTPMMDGNPFHASVAHNIRHIGILLLIFDIVQQISQFAISVYASSLIRQHVLSDGSLIISDHFQLNLTGVLVFFVLLLVSYVFQYGTQLQQLSDETL